MAQLRVKQVGEARGMNLNKLYRALNEARQTRHEDWIAQGTVRRYWHSTKDGVLSSEPLDQISWSFLQEIAAVYGCSVYELLPEDDGLGNKLPTLRRAVKQVA